MNRAQKIKNLSCRVVEALKWRATKLFRAKPVVKSHDELDSRITFLIAHFNSPEFLAACLDGIRKFHPGSAILVADATSDWSSYLEAKKKCEEYGAEMWPLAIQHRHSGLLNFLLRQAKTDFAVFLDQDCILLHRLDAILKRVDDGILLAGPRDEMLVDYQLRSGENPNFQPKLLRKFKNYVHASLMALQPATIRARYGNSPFGWDKSFGQHHHEKYHGLAHQLYESNREAVLFLDSIHSAYGLGMVYLYENVPLAYHNWYSGRVFKLEGTIDNLPIERLKGSMDRFLKDYWEGNLKLGLPSGIQK